MPTYGRRAVNCAALFLFALIVENASMGAERTARLNPSVDIVFKKLFGDEKNKNMLLSFINSFMAVEHMLQDVYLLNGYKVVHYTIDRLNLLEVEGRGINGKRYRINIELRDKGRYDKQGLDAWATKLSDRIEEDIDYLDVYRGFGVHVLNYKCVNNTRYHNAFNVSRKADGDKCSTNLELHTLELWKFNETHINRTLDEIADNLTGTLDLWMLFLTKQRIITNATHFPAQLEARDEDKSFKRAMGELEAMTLTVEEDHIYDRHHKFMF